MTAQELLDLARTARDESVEGERAARRLARAVTLVLGGTDGETFAQYHAKVVSERDAPRAELERMRSLVFKACSLGDDAAFMRKDCNAFMAGFDEIRSAAKEGR